MRPVPPVCQIGSRPQSTEAAITAPGEVPPSGPSLALSFLDPIKHSLIGDPGRHTLIMSDLAVESDALLTH